MKKISLLSFVFVLMLVSLTGCHSASAKEPSNDQVVIFSNADDEAIEILKEQLDSHGYEGQYVIQVIGTGELAGRIQAEGTQSQADIVTLSTFHIASSKDVFAPFKTKDGLNTGTENYQSPILGLEASLFINTQVMEQANLPMPKSLKDLANPVYEGYISLGDLNSSSTGWLFVQALMDNYEVSEVQEILAGVIANAGPHLETSGSAPIVKTRSGEVAIGFGLRQQGLSAQSEGLPVEVINVSEGNYILTESVALLNKETINPKAIEIVEFIANNTREALMSVYPTPLYEDERASQEDLDRVKFYSESLTRELLDQHIVIFNSAK